MALVALGLAFLGCSSDKITGDGDSDGPGRLSPEQRAAVVESIRDRVATLLPAGDTPREERDVVEEIEQVGGAVVELPDVIAVFVDRRTATAQAVLRDGLSVQIINNRPVPSSLASASGPMHARSAGRAGAAVASLDPPGSGRAVVTSFDGGAAVAAQVRGMLAAAGYEILPLGASLDDMRRYSNLGVLYLDTHSGSYRRIRVEPTQDGGVRVDPGEITFSLQTATTVSARSLREHEADLDAGRVAVSIGPGPEGPQARLAITERFIAQNWSFDRGIVMLHACFAGSEPFAPGRFNFCLGACDPEDEDVLDPTPIRSAILAADARLMVSFDDLTNAEQGESSILYFFDRVLGANEFEPEDPPQRPFAGDQVRSDMGRKGLLSFGLPIYVGEIPTGLDREVGVTFHGDPAGALGAPTIQNMQVIDDAAEAMGELRLSGQFGPDPGEIWVGSLPVTVEGWSRDEVVALVPFEGRGAHGEVRALAPGNVASNPVPLTKWEGTITLTTDPNEGSLLAWTDVDAVFRADIHRYRERIAVSPQDPSTVTAYISPASSGAVHGSGSHQEGDTRQTWYGSAPVEMLTKAEVDAGGVPPLADPPAPGGPFGGLVELRLAAGEATICFLHHGYVNVRSEDPDGTAEDVFLLVFPVEQVVDSTRGLFACLKLPLRDDYSIPSGSRSHTEPESGWTTRLEWTEFQPVDAPDEETPA